MKNKTLFLLSAGLFAVGFWIYSKKKKDDQAKTATDLKNAELESSQAAPGNTGIVAPPLATQGIVASVPKGGETSTGYTVVVNKQPYDIESISLVNTY